MADPTRRMIINVASLDEVRARSLRAAEGGAFAGRYVTFGTLELLWKAFSPKRLDLLRALAGQEPMAIRELARRVKRDVKAVHGDVQALMERGIIEKTAAGQIWLPYDEVKIDVTLTPAAAA